MINIIIFNNILREKYEVFINKVITFEEWTENEGLWNALTKRKG